MNIEGVHFWKRGKTYYYRLPGEKTFHSTKQTNKALARAYVADILNNGKESKATLAEYAKDFYKWDVCQWIKRQKAKGRSFTETQAKARRKQLEKYLLPQFGSKRLEQLNPVEFENWLIGLDLANGTKNSILYTMRIILREAKREKVIRHDPLVDVEPLANQYKKRDAFTLEELKRLFPKDEERLLEVWEERYYTTLFHTMLTTGMRVGEILALQWKHIILEKRAILILQAVKAGGKIGTPKSGESRSVLIPGRTYEMLKKWNEESPLSGADDFVFFGKKMDFRTQPLNRRTLDDKFKRALKVAQIDIDGRNIVIHSFRHTYNTIMRSKLTEEQLHYMMGHKSRAMTDRYDQATPLQKVEALLPALEKIDNVWQ